MAEDTDDKTEDPTQKRLDEAHERGVPNCYTSVNYGDGKCVIDVSRFPPGKFVPVTVSFNYGGKTYSAQTGFTPREP